jgi:hypothetical protein
VHCESAPSKNIRENNFMSELSSRCSSDSGSVLQSCGDVTVMCPIVTVM